eukprot:9059687-Pyramimonas_sp.AAC.1
MCIRDSPYSGQEGTGDAIEGVLGICKPGSATGSTSAPKEVSFRELFWKVLGTCQGRLSAPAWPLRRRPGTRRLPGAR